jgi:hypothetical protein
VRLEFEEILRLYPRAQKEPLAGHPIARLLQRELPTLIPATVLTKHDKVEGSPGRGNWAETPWVAVFDQRITDSAEHGVYVVYLFDSSGRHLYLSLNQGTTAVREALGREYRRALATRARTMLRIIGEGPAGFSDGPIDLQARGSLTRGYESGNVLSRRYVRSQVPADQELIRDLSALLATYRALVESGWRGLTSAEVLQ